MSSSKAYNFWGTFHLGSLYDMKNFFTVIYNKINYGEEVNDEKQNILDMKAVFSSLIHEISDRISREKHLKKFSIVELVQGFLKKTDEGKYMDAVSNNMHHKKTLLNQKYKTQLAEQQWMIKEGKDRSSQIQMITGSATKSSIYNQLTKIISFLRKFADEEK